MNKGIFNLVIDTVAAALLTTLVGTGYILLFVLPPGTNRTHLLWGLMRHQWGTVHVWISAILLAVLAVHVALHWRWLVTGLSKRFGVAAWAARSPRLAGLAVLTAAALPLIMLVLAAHVSVGPLDSPLHPLTEEAKAGAAPEPPQTAAEQASPAPASPGSSGHAAGRDAAHAQAAHVLAQRCAGCHSVRNPAAGVRADTPQALRAEQGGVRWLTPGRPDESRLFDVVGVPSQAGQITPKHHLSQSEVDALRAWIASLEE